MIQGDECSATDHTFLARALHRQGKAEPAKATRDRAEVPMHGRSMGSIDLAIEKPRP